MKKNCINCENPNPDSWFYCKKCGKKSSSSKYTTNLYMISDIGKRTDIEFTNMSVDESVKDMNRSKYANSKR